MILLDEIYRNEGCRIIIFFGLFLLGISLILLCGKEGGGRRPRRKQLQKQNDDIDAGDGGKKKKIKEKDPFGSERSRKKKRKKSKNRKQKSPPSNSRKNHEKVVKKPQKEEELNENVETGIQESDNNNNVAPASVDPKNEQPLSPVGDEEDDDGGIEAKYPHFGSDKENQQKSNPLQVSESEAQKQAEKLRSLKEQDTPLHTDDFEWLKDKTAAKNGITSKNNIHPAPADAVAPPPAAVAHPALSNLRPPPATAPEAGAVAGEEEEEEEEANEENDKDSAKKMNKKKKKKHSSKKKKKKKEKSSKKKKASKKHDIIEKEKYVKKKDEPEIIYPYSLTLSSTKNEKLKDTNEKGLTTIINDELMTKENVEEQQQHQEQIVEAKTQQMTVKTDLNQSKLRQPNIDKTQKKTAATTSKYLTGIEEENNNNNYDGASKTIYNLAVNGAPGNEIKLPLKELTAKDENGQSKLSETPQAIFLQPNENQNGTLKTIYNPTVNGGSAAPVGQMKLPLLTKELRAKSDLNSLLPPPANIPNEEGQQQQQHKLEAASKTIYNPATNGGSLAPASKMKLPILTKESATKSDWNSVLAASSIISANNEQQAAAADGKESGKKMS